MKAYEVYDKDDMFSTIVFAETSGKAKALALLTDTCEESEFTRIRVKRVPKADCLYKDSWEIDWYDPKQRLYLVKEMGWSCYEPEIDECENCKARLYCDYFQEYLKNEDEEILALKGYEI